MLCRNSILPNNDLYEFKKSGRARGGPSPVAAGKPVTPSTETGRWVGNPHATRGGPHPSGLRVRGLNCSFLFVLHRPAPFIPPFSPFSPRFPPFPGGRQALNPLNREENDQRCKRISLPA
jgi:hypothetical protein